MHLLSELTKWGSNYDLKTLKTLLEKLSNHQCESCNTSNASSLVATCKKSQSVEGWTSAFFLLEREESTEEVLKQLESLDSRVANMSSSEKWKICQLLRNNNNKSAHSVLLQVIKKLLPHSGKNLQTMTDVVPHCRWITELVL